MSARSARKSLPIRLDDAGWAALDRHRRASGLRSLPATLRRLLGRALTDGTPPAPCSDAPRRGRVLRLQLEPALRAALARKAAEAGLSPVEMAERLLASALQR